MKPIFERKGDTIYIINDHRSIALSINDILKITDDDIDKIIYELVGVCVSSYVEDVIEHSCAELYYKIRIKQFIKELL